MKPLRKRDVTKLRRHKTLHKGRIEWLGIYDSHRKLSSKHTRGDVIEVEATKNNVIDALFMNAIYLETEEKIKYLNSLPLSKLLRLAKKYSLVTDSKKYDPSLSYTAEEIKAIKKRVYVIICQERLISKREDRIKKEIGGFGFNETPAPGSTGSISYHKNLKVARIQIGSAYGGKYNYARCMVINWDGK